MNNTNSWILQATGGDEWQEWDQIEEFSVKVEPASSAEQQSPSDDDLFHDMIPVFQKTKKVSD